MDLNELLNQKIFLGQEFLTWLWHLSETEGGAEMPELNWVEVSLGERMVLGPAMGDEGARITVSGHEASVAEAREALRQGKLVESLRLGLEIHGEEYWLNLDAAELGIKSLKLPSAARMGEDPEGLEGLVLERVAMMESALKALEGLFKRFLAQRLDSNEGPELRKALAAWAAEEA
ncbi:MAG: hypothetical protein K9K66_13270 [Desulfarculaceae bacterium]|nr:hypothetical protein [Desulfarculaceae bacterium]MCF8073935.1 hypothetical protein [Desulfarculaceae bacterium]MCF8102621.1 hypothetical protein [Desulfarculaceae bacterium]MCF8117610.1 hypothetical protein [Desulfarculaceae bacterium]